MEGAGVGQTREHAQLVRSLGVEQLAVVVTKLDTVDSSPQVGMQHPRNRVRLDRQQVSGRDIVC